ncbi:MAG: AAA family ATPase, partial [Nannocystaceae bacterium]
GRFLERMSRARGRIPSMILWGPPGSGKTTIARLFAQATQAHFETLSATSDGVRRVREVLRDARQRRTGEGRATVVFIDEIHRFNKGQQDALLADVERGVCSLIGATTRS